MSDGVSEDILELDESFAGNVPPPVQNAINVFIENIPGRVAAIRRSSKEKDAEELLKLLHGFKGGAGTCGFFKLYDELCLLEDRVRDGEYDGLLLSHLDKIEEAVETRLSN
jgi:HPt (histidine-containing phosphotransfer) domain-containing protein